MMGDIRCALPGRNLECPAFKLLAGKRFESKRPLNKEVLRAFAIRALDVDEFWRLLRSLRVRSLRAPELWVVGGVYFFSHWRCPIAKNRVAGDTEHWQGAPKSRSQCHRSRQASRTVQGRARRAPGGSK
jgi:hypothetical protein